MANNNNSYSPQAWCNAGVYKGNIRFGFLFLLLLFNIFITVEKRSTKKEIKFCCDAQDLH